jgi:hypothetical protein
MKIAVRQHSMAVKRTKKTVKNMKLETIDETCKQPAGSFKKFIEKKETHLRNLDQQRKARIQAARKAAWELGIAA